MQQCSAEDNICSFIIDETKAYIASKLADVARTSGFFTEAAIAV